MRLSTSALVFVGAGAVLAASSAGRAAPGLDGCVRAGAQTRIVAIGGSSNRAAVVGRGRDGIVLSDQSDRDLCAWLPFARTLAREGYRVLLYDYAAASPWTDVAAAAVALHRDGAARVMLIGASEGAKASIIAAARGAPVTAVVSLSAERYFRGGTDVKPFAARLTLAVLFVTARHDPYAAADTPLLYRACRSSRKRLLTARGEAHGIDLLDGTEGAEVRAAVLRFLRAHR